MTPTARTLSYLRGLGYLVAVVERWIPGACVRSDLWHFADVLAVHPRDRFFLLVQVTTAGHLPARLAKAKCRPELAAWLRAGVVLKSTAGNRAAAAGGCGASKSVARTTWRKWCCRPHVGHGRASASAACSMPRRSC
jgi:hypothetical protein